MCYPILSTAAQQTPCAAKLLDAEQRQRLAIDALAGTQPVSHIAEEHDVSRKFVYQQTAKAEQALHEAFAPAAADDQVLFHLAVTKAWLRQFILALVLICHSPLRGVVELLRDLFGLNLSLGTVHNVVHSAVERARQHNQHQDLSNVRIGAHDEIFQNNLPVLAGVDVDSTYCYLLSLEDHRDGDTWGLHLLELQDRGFAPEATIADAGGGIRKGQKLALPGVTCRGDVFHALKDVNELVGYLNNRAYDAIAARDKLEHKQTKSQRRLQKRDPKVAQHLSHARAAEADAIDLADDVALLAKWLQHDIFAVAGPAYLERRVLCDFVVAELRRREQCCPHRIGKVANMLQNQRDDLLAFAAALDRNLETLADEFEVSVTLVRQLLHVQTLDPNRPQRWQKESRLREQLHGRFYHLSEAVADVAARTVRASSIVENYNSRLRSYFFLRRHLGPNYLHLLQFFLNHRRFLRSERPERAGKSPAELLTGRSHPHWLEMLGYQLQKPK